MTSQLPLAEAIARAVLEIDDARTIEETLDFIVHATTASIPSFEHVSISLRDKGGEIETKSGTDALVWELDAVQYSLMEGPCVDAIEHEPVVVVEHLRHEQRWPRYIRTAVENGVRSQLGIQMFSRGKHVGGLNLYSTRFDEIERDSIDTARLLAAHASVVLGHVQEEQHLNQALMTRKVIGQAIGILMERYRIDDERALQFLLRASSTSNLKLRAVATEVVETATHSYLSKDRTSGSFVED